jgi:hypothetical protein
MAGAGLFSHPDTVSASLRAVPSSDDPGLFRAAIETAGEAVLITSPELDLPGPVILYANPPSRA